MKKIKISFTLFICLIAITVQSQTYSDDTLAISKKLRSLSKAGLSQDSIITVLPAIITQAKKINYKKGLADTYLLKGITYYRLGKYKDAILAYEQCLLNRDTIKEYKETARAYNNMALAYKDMSAFEQALNMHNKALTIRLKNKDSLGMAGSIMNIGLIYERQGDYDKSQSHYFNSLKIRVLINDSDGISSCLNNIGTSFFYAGKSEKALEYYNKSLDIAVLRKNQLDVAKSYGNMAMIYDDQKKYSEALSYYERALKAFLLLRNPFNIATCYNNIALVYNNLGNNDKAIEYHIKSLAIKEQIGDKVGTITSYLNISKIYIDQKKADKALVYLKKSLELSLSLNDKPFLLNTYKGLAEVYRLKGDYEKCFSNYQLYTMYKDSLFTIEKLGKISELEGLYNTEKATKELLSKDLMLKEESLISTQRRDYLIIVIISLCAVVIMLIYLLINNRKTKQLNHRLKNKISENELLLAEINHRTKNNLQIVSGLLKLPQKEIDAESAKEVMSSTRERVNAIAIIHKLLYQSSTTTEVNMQKYLKELSNSLVRNLGSDNIKIETDIPEVSLDIDLTVPIGLIANELLTNCIKHAFSSVQNPSINVSLLNKQSHLELIISDNGNKDVTPLTTQNTNSFGLKMINTLVEQINGSLKTYFDNGMHFHLTFTNKSIH